MKPRLIAFYLPQYYPTPENDAWWEPGFTEWTNVAKARPLYKGHYQPRIPRDLGFYDLRVSETREKQAEMASDAGIEGFCYWHYWFAGTRLLDRVFKEVVESGSPDFPFCLCWANHSWYQKTWDPTKPDKLLIEQTYPGKDDFVAHFNAMLPSFKDKRYMKVDGKLIFAVFEPLYMPDRELFFETWNSLAKENGLNGFYFVAFNTRIGKEEELLKVGFDAVTNDYISKVQIDQNPIIYKIRLALRKFLRIPLLIGYGKYSNCVLNNYMPQDNIHPCIIPDFDHSPRSAHRGTILKNSTPEKWGFLCRNVFKRCSIRKQEHNLVFIKAWNEWGEGNYLEPDCRYGHSYLEQLKKTI